MESSTLDDGLIDSVETRKSSKSLKSAIKFAIAIGLFLFGPIMGLLIPSMGAHQYSLFVEFVIETLTMVCNLSYFILSIWGTIQGIDAFRAKEPFPIKYVGLIGNGLLFLFFLLSIVHSL